MLINNTSTGNKSVDTIRRGRGGRRNVHSERMDDAKKLVGEGGKRHRAMETAQSIEAQREKGGKRSEQTDGG